MAFEVRWPQYHDGMRYSDKSDLNTLNICLPRSPTNDSKQLWIIYLHGGAWRDPAIDATSFNKTLHLLLSSPAIKHIAGLASINYRLSPYPSHPHHPSKPGDPARNARHQDHIDDVLTAIGWLQRKYEFRSNYLLVGHSCGATMALQVGMSRKWTNIKHDIAPPAAIVGFEGIYDIPALVDRHSDQAIYEQFITDAFGPDREVWKAVSPVNGDYKRSWKDHKIAVLAHSREDELVELEQVTSMQEVLEDQGFAQAEALIAEVKGKHDEIWQDGTEMVRVIADTISLLVSEGRTTPPVLER